jgi:hypothetical protein
MKNENVSSELISSILMGTVLCREKYLRYSGVLNRVEKKIHHGIRQIEKQREDSMS